MKTDMKKQPTVVRFLIAAGLLMVTLPALLSRFIPLPDFLHGFLAGAGIGLEIVGIIKLKRHQKLECDETVSP